MCIYILSIFVCSLSGPGLATSVLLNFKHIHSVLKPARKVMPQGSQQRRRGGGSPEERPYDVSRGQNRYVMLP